MKLKRKICKISISLGLIKFRIKLQRNLQSGVVIKCDYNKFIKSNRTLLWPERLTWL